MRRLVLWAPAAAVWMASPVMAQQLPRPDAGQTLQQQQPALQAPLKGKGVVVPQGERSKPAKGGTKVYIKNVRFSGNTIFSDEQLRDVAAVGDTALDFAQLDEAANRITTFYREQGYPFARAVLTSGGLKKGELTMTVTEGRYGEVSVKTENARHQAQAQGFVARLARGSVIERGDLERATSLLNDQPGYSVTPVMRPGQKIGEGDLDMNLVRDNAFDGGISVNNYGNRFTGYLQFRGDLAWNSPFMFGDRLSGSYLVTEQAMQYGSLNYALPLGSSGLRGNVGYALTGYELGREFSNLDATGTAGTTTVGLSYPIIRSVRSNLYVSGTYANKQLEDRINTTNTVDDKDSNSFTTALSFDHSDDLGGMTFGNLGWTYGHLNVSNVAADVLNTRGDFHRFNLDATRLQRIVGNLSLALSLSSQWSDKNLDSSEGISLGGMSGVRAYPTGEATGDESVLGRAELRYAAGLATPFAFFDIGRVWVDANPLPTNTNNERNLSGIGFGSRFQYQGFSLDSAVSFRLNGGAATADGTRNPSLRAWIGMGYSF